MEDVGKEGRTVIFVSHNLEAVQRLCGRCLLLKNGELIMDRDPEAVAAQYIKHSLGEIGLSYKNLRLTTLRDRTQGKTS
jgi:ABC-type polysaccharide/polyol phosphate transport system ATPase subunit